MEFGHSHSFGAPINPEAVLNKLIGLLPSVMINPLSPNPFNNSAYYLGPASAIDIKVSDPITSIIFLNFSDSILDNSYANAISLLLFSY